jgi:hypothetical protein
VVNSPNSAPTNVFSFSVGEIITVAVDDLEVDTGWTAGVPGDTATGGVWVRTDPTGTEASPDLDHTATPGVNCWITGNSTSTNQNAHDVDGGTTTLLSPVYDLSSAATASVSYWRWFYNDNVDNPLHDDVFTVDITNDGTNWVNVEVVGPTGSEVSGGWFNHTFLVSDFVTPTATVQLRFVAADLSFNSTVEAGVDDLTIDFFN